MLVCVCILTVRQTTDERRDMDNPRHTRQPGCQEFPARVNRDLELHNTHDSRKNQLFESYLYVRVRCSGECIGSDDTDYLLTMYLSVHAVSYSSRFVTGAHEIANYKP